MSKNMQNLAQQLNDYFSRTRPGVGFTSDDRIKNITVNSILKDKIPKQIIEMAFNKGILNKNSTLLDMGCGLGGILEAAREKGVEDVYGIDIDEDAVKISASRINEEGRVFVDDGEKIINNLPKFDLITSVQVIEHVKNPLEYLKQARNLLKEDGKILITCPNFLFPWEGHYKMPYFPYLLPHTKPFFKFLVRKLNMNHNIADYIHFDTTPGKLRKLLKKAGFNEVQDHSVARFMERIEKPELIDNPSIMKVAIVVSNIVKRLRLMGLFKLTIEKLKMYHPIVLIAKS